MIQCGFTENRFLDVKKSMDFPLNWSTNVDVFLTMSAGGWENHSSLGDFARFSDVFNVFFWNDSHSQWGVEVLGAVFSILNHPMTQYVFCIPEIAIWHLHVCRSTPRVSGWIRNHELLAKKNAICLWFVGSHTTIGYHILPQNTPNIGDDHGFPMGFSATAGGFLKDLRAMCSIPAMTYARCRTWPVASRRVSCCCQPNSRRLRWTTGRPLAVFEC